MNNNIINEIISRLEEIPFNTETTIADLINYNPEENFVEPIEQGKIFNEIINECRQKDIILEQIKDEFTGLAFYYKFKKQNESEKIGMNTKYTIKSNVTYTDEETRKEHQNYVDKINEYNRKIANGETPDWDISELMDEHKAKFENKVIVNEDKIEEKETEINESEKIIDDVLGELIFQKKYGWYSGKIKVNTSNVEVQINSTNLEEERIKLRKVFENFSEYDSKFKKALAKSMLEFKNEMWLSDDEEPLTEEQFIDNLKLTCIACSRNNTFELWYDGRDDMFWGHVVRAYYEIDNDEISWDLLG